ncbi:MAG: hypothetical protein HY866_07740 [Chloroflexi bacterium]|nr:hypothetical protein [Chloroflexota bacterium]
MHKIKVLAGIVMVVALIGGSWLALPSRPALAQDGLTPGTPVEGVVTSDEGVSYTIDASRGQLILISMDSAEFDTYLTISDAAGNELASDDDSGSDTNALLAYVAQADGSFTITAKPSWSGTGAYTLTPNVIDPPMVDLGGSSTLTPGAEDEVTYVVFEAAQGTVVNVSAITQSEDDISVELMGVDAQSIELDDDDGPGNNALLRRVVLKGDGLYLVKVASTWSGTPFTAPIDVTVETTEQLFLTAEPYPVSLNDTDLGTEVFTFEATTGVVYRITVTCALNTGIEMELLDTSAFFTPDFETGNAVKVTWEYKSDVDGLVRLNVHPSFFSDGDDLTFMIEVVE